ncbi:DUF4405 domain-containing protein [bacterium]|nr:DUF4405 domain-containing protein [bacterium]
MNKLKLKTKFIIDIFLAAAFMFNVVTALILLFNTGGGGNRQSTWLVNLFDFSSLSSVRLIHDWSGLLMVALIVFHLMLNWRIILCYFKNLSRSTTKVAKVEQTCKNI